MDVKSYALGYNAGASQKGGNVSQAELEAAIKKVVPEWALEKTPPKDAVTSVNGKMGEVSLSIPSKASDINAEEAGAVSTHNADQLAHPYLSGRVDNALERISGHDADIEEINTSVAERLKTADLAAKLDNYKAVQGLVSNTTSNLTNYYLKSEIYTKEEVAALISAIPKFEIKVVSSLPTSNISLTTVYLVKDTTEGGGLYTEYIYVNGVWEELGSQTLDLSGYVTDEELDNLLKSYATLTKVSELIADALKPYATEDEITEAIRVATVNFVTGEQVTTAINNALKAYYTSAQVDAEIAAQIKTALTPYTLKEDANKAYQPAGDYPTTADMGTAISEATKDLAPKSSVPTKVSQLPNDSGYLTSATGDLRYAKPSDIPTVPMSVYDFAVAGGYTGSEDDLKKQLAIEIKFDNGNLFNKAETTEGHYMNGTGGLSADAASAVTGFISVKPNTTYIRTLGATAYPIHEYNSSQTRKRTISGNPFTTSSDCYFIRTTIATKQTPIDTYMVCEGTSLPSGYVPYGPSLRIAGQNVALDAADSTLPLFGKLGVIGDSLSNQEKWQTTACAVANITEWHKNAITGSCLASYPDATKVPFVDRYLETPEDCDCITIMGGTNDANDEHGHGDNMGEVGVLSNGTFKGAYSTIIEGLLARKPSVRILLITPPRSYTKYNALNEYVKLYADATKEVAEYYGLPCLDLYNALGINDKTFTYMLYDNVHLSDEGGLRVGRMIGNFIKTYY